MNVGLHQCPKGSIDQAMASQRFEALEAVRHDRHGEVSTAVTSARMTGMSVALVDNLEHIRAERRLELRPYLRDAHGTHGSPRLVKPTLTAGYFSDCDSLGSGGASVGAAFEAIQTACTMATTNITPVVPNTLKSTQIDSEK
jgi:hypothetical protein